MSIPTDKTFHAKSDLIRLFPYGITLGGDVGRPMMIMKSEDEAISFPVFMGPLDAAVVVDHKMKRTSTHEQNGLLLRMLSSLDIELSKCIFTDISGQRQYGNVYFRNHPNLRKMRIPVEEMMTFCLQMEVPFYGTWSFIQESRVMKSENIVQGLQVASTVEVRTHKYLM